MADVLLTLVMPEDVAQHVEDLLLGHPELIVGFTATHVDGHGSAVRLVEARELVRGHAPRIQIQTVGREAAMRAALALIKEHLPQANVFYWLQPVIESGRL